MSAREGEMSKPQHEEMRDAAALMRTDAEFSGDAVALAVAVWLDQEANNCEASTATWSDSSKDPRNRWQERGLTVADNVEHHWQAPLAVARAFAASRFRPAFPLAESPRCQEPRCPSFGDRDFGEATCPAAHAYPSDVRCVIRALNKLAKERP